MSFDFESKRHYLKTNFKNTLNCVMHTDRTKKFEFKRKMLPLTKRPPKVTEIRTAHVTCLANSNHNFKVNLLRLYIELKFQFRNDLIYRYITKSFFSVVRDCLGVKDASNVLWDSFWVWKGAIFFVVY